MGHFMYYPEGFVKTSESLTVSMLEKAKLNDQILEAKAVLCDGNHNLIVDLGEIKGIIPREEAAMGIKEGLVKDIAVLSRVNKPVCFKVNGIYKRNGEAQASLSRVSAQNEALTYMLESYHPGDVINAKITHLEPFGAFADIGCGIVGMISIENISVSRISHPKERFSIGQNIKVVIKDIDYERKRFTLSHKELLGTWEENADLFSIGQTVCGKIRSVEEYGIFVELTPNLAGLAEYKEGVQSGQQATVYIKNIIPDKMKIKLSIIDHFDDDSFCDAEAKDRYAYFYDEERMEKFIYSPPSASKIIETVF